MDELNGIFAAYGADAVNEAVKRLVEDKYVVYLKRSNSYLRLKETSGVDIRAQISYIVEKHNLIRRRIWIIEKDISV